MKVLRLLQIDDDEVDLMNLKRVVKKASLPHTLSSQPNGLEGFNHLERLEDEELPHVILLDINMPKMNGHEFLEKIKKNQRYSKILIYVVTTSNQELDVAKAYDNGAAGYFVKPLDFKEYIELIKVLNDFWQLQRFPGIE